MPSGSGWCQQLAQAPHVLQHGVPHGALHGRAAPAHGLTLGHRPQSVAISTLGGWLACRSAGQYSTRYGKIEDMVVGLDVALAGGRRRQVGARPRDAEGGGSADSRHPPR